jgi:hypothetical protein
MRVDDTSWQDNLSGVVLYDIKKNECKQLAPLPYEVSEMATVRCGGNIVVIGGVDKCGNTLDTVIIYNVKTEQSHFALACCRQWDVRGRDVLQQCYWKQHCSIRRKGRRGEQCHELKPSEAFNFERYTWQELPEVSQATSFHAAVVVWTMQECWTHFFKITTWLWSYCKPLN